MAAILTSVLSLGGSGLSVYFSYHAQDRQVRIEQVSKFDAASNNLLEAAGVFIAAINAGKQQDIDAARIKVRTVVAGQIQDTEIFRNTFDGGVTSLINQYQTALGQFSQVAENTKSVIEMRPWVESFGRVLDSRRALSVALSRELGFRARSGA